MSVDRENLVHFMPVPIQDFQPQLEGLSNREKIVIETLSNAVRAVGRVYVHQLQRYPHPYPHNISSERIRQAAEKDPAIFSPYTFVDQDAEGNLKATPYHELFRTQLEPVTQYLIDAANVAKTYDPDLELYLRTRAKNLLDGNYEQSEEIWLNQPDARIRLVIGPYDRYPDNRFNRKFYYGGILDIKNEQASNHHMRAVSALIEAWSKSGISAVEIPDLKVRIRYGKTVISSGLPADMRLTANSLPCQREWRERYGTEIIVLEPAFISRFFKERLPLIRQIIHPELRRRQSDEDLLDDYGLVFDAHETAHAFIRQEGDEERYGNEYIFMNEMTATVVGMALLKDIGLSQKQLEGVLAARFAIMAALLRDYLSGDRSREDYLDGEVVIFNRLLKNGSISMDDDGRVSWQDINEIFDSLKIDAKRLVELLASGNINSAKSLKRWKSTEAVKRLFPFRQKRSLSHIETSNEQLAGQDPIQNLSDEGILFLTPTTLDPTTTQSSRP